MQLSIVRSFLEACFSSLKSDILSVIKYQRIRIFYILIDVFLLVKDCIMDAGRQMEGVEDSAMCTDTFEFQTNTDRTIKKKTEQNTSQFELDKTQERFKIP